MARRRIIIVNEPVRSFIKGVSRRVRSTRIISGANIYEYQFDIDDVHRYLHFFGFDVAVSRRNWLLAGRVRLCYVLNTVGLAGLGNRFSAVYDRLD